MRLLQKGQDSRFFDFVRELAKLSLKHGVVISTFGGVNILDDTTWHEIKRVAYSDDPTSEDLSYLLLREKPIPNEVILLSKGDYSSLEDLYNAYRPFREAKDEHIGIFHENRYYLFPGTLANNFKELGHQIIYLGKIFTL